MAHAALSSAFQVRSFASGLATNASNRKVSMAAKREMWLPGGNAPAHLDGSMAGDFGFDPLGLGADPAAMTWYREAELQHCRWAMAGVAGILGQEIVKPDVFFYNAASEIEPVFPILGIVGFQFLTMHWVEVRRWRDVVKPGSVNQDPIFDYSVPEHDVGYPGGVFDPFGFAKGDLDELKKKEIKNGRLAMLAFLGFIVQAQVLGKGPIACLKDHLENPWTHTLLAKSLITPTTVISPGCAIPPTVEYLGVTIPTPCLPLWPGSI